MDELIEIQKGLDSLTANIEGFAKKLEEDEHYRTRMFRILNPYANNTVVGISNTYGYVVAVKLECSITESICKIKTYMSRETKRTLRAFLIVSMEPDLMKDVHTEVTL